MGGITTVISLIVCSLSPFSSPPLPLSLSSNPKPLYLSISLSLSRSPPPLILFISPNPHSLVFHTCIHTQMFLILCSLGVLLMFIAWHYRLTFMYCADVVVDRWNSCWPNNRERLVELIRKHRGKVNPSL